MATSELPRVDVDAAPNDDAPPPPPGNDDLRGATMTLVEHLEELRRRLIVCLIAIGAGSVLGFIFWDPILGFLMLPLPASANRLLDSAGGGTRLLTTQIGEPFFVALKIGIAVGIALAVPVLLYQLWAFISPGLTARERGYALPFTLLGVVLFAVGVVVGFFVLRFPVDWLIHFGGNRFVVLLDANAYFSFIAFFLLAFGIVFELPLLVTFLGIVGIVSSTVLRQKRAYILFGLWLLSAFITPGADPYSPVIIGVSFTVLFELSIILLRILKK